MIRRAATVLALSAGLSLVMASPALAGTGPYASTVTQGQSQSFSYDSYPRTGACLQYVTNYTVSLAYLPPGDTLTLTAAGHTATASSGSTAVGFQAGVCTRFTITVTGTAVADVAAFVVQVRSGPTGGVIATG